MPGSNKLSLQSDMTDDSAKCALGYEMKQTKCRSKTDNSNTASINQQLTQS